MSAFAPDSFLRRVATRVRAAGFCSGLFLLLAAGCSRDSSSGTFGGFTGPSFGPLPPAFLSGPAGVLLTNGSGFTAHVAVTTKPGSAQPDYPSGELLGRGNKLLFAPGRDPQKERGRAGLSFIWDVGSGGGYVLSEALQAYAPYTTGTVATNVTSQPAAGTPEKVEGHSCEELQQVVQMSNGSSASFQVARAVDRGRFPVRISSLTNAPEFTLTFSKIRIEAPPADVFAPPSEFTRYSNPESMISELIIRQHNLKGRRPEAVEPAPEYTQPRPR